MSQGHIKIDSYASKHRLDRSAEEQHLFILPIENIIRPSVNLNRLSDVIGERGIPHVEMRKRLDIAGIVKTLPDESPFQIRAQRFDRLVT